MREAPSISEKAVQSLLQAHGSRIVAVALFGSVARGEEDARSDMDFLVVVRDFPWSLERRYLLYEPVHRAVNEGTERKRDVTVIDVDESDILNDGLEVSPLLINIASDAKMIYDPEGILLGFVGKVKRLIEAAGLERYGTKEGKYGWKPRAGGLHEAEV